MMRLFNHVLLTTRRGQRVALGLWFAGIFLILGNTWLVGSVAAHAGGTPLIVNELAGDFVVSVWSLPNPLARDVESNFIAFVAEGEDFDQLRAATPVLGAAIEFTFSKGLQSFDLAATHERATNKLFYESYPTFSDGGTWTVDMRVTHEGLSGEAQFLVEVTEPEPEINWLLYGGIGLVVIAVGWFVWQSMNDDEDEVDQVAKKVSA